jgi:hypothetical protein
MESCHDRAMLDYYQRSWARILVIFFGWPEDRGERWARFEIDCVGDNPLLTTELPAWYFVGFLLPPNHSGQAIDDVISAIHGRGQAPADLLDDAYDRDAARQRLRAALAKHGVDLDRLDTTDLNARWPV